MSQSVHVEIKTRGFFYRLYAFQQFHEYISTLLGNTGPDSYNLLKR